MKNLLRAHTAVKWLPWSPIAFERSREEGKVILLSLSTAWSRACHEMDEQCYADAAVAREINDWFVPVRVDADRRPDIAERYDLGGLPTTAFLNADGQVLGGGTFVSRDRLASALARLRHDGRALSTPHSKLQTPKQSKSAEEISFGVGSLECGVDAIEALTALVFQSFDHQHGGFGDAPKFPLAAPVRLALDLFQESPSEELAAYVTRTLDAVDGALYDEERGGFFRCGARADWQEPQREKLLVTNAVLVDLFLECGAALRNDRWLARAADAIQYVQGNLAGAPGDGWRASEESDGARLSDANARMASAALHAARVFEDRSLGELALQSLESVLLASYRPGRGVAHCAGGIRGLLTDHIAMITAHLDAWEATGEVPYQMMARELAEYTVRTMSDASGGFLDRAPADVDAELGLLGCRVKPFVLNCEAAEALHRLGGAVEAPEFGRLARSALDAIHGGAAQHGPLAAHYVLAHRTLLR